MTTAVDRPPARADRAPPHDGTRAAARLVVRQALERQPGFARLSADERRALARSCVDLASHAAELSDQGPAAPERATTRSLGAGDELGLQATRAVADTTRRVLDAVSFPRFVEELVVGIFKALTASQVEQIDSYLELLRNISTSAEAFGERAIGDGGAQQWLAETYPSVFEVSGGSSAEDDEDEESEPGGATIRLRPGASFPDDSQLRADLELGSGQPVPRNPEQLLPLVRRQLARTRQQVLATLVQMGLQRIVIENGMVEAGMRFHIDASSAAEVDRGDRFDVRNEISGSGSFGYPPWSASAKVSNTIGYVRTEQAHTTEQVNTSVDLNSRVLINFRSDYLPLASLAGPEEAAQVRARSRNPDFDANEAAATTAARVAPTPMADRRRNLAESLRPTAAPEPPAVPPISAKLPAGAGAPPPAGGSVTPPPG